MVRRLPGPVSSLRILPLWDVEEPEGIKRIADKGCHAVTFSETRRR